MSAPHPLNSDPDFGKCLSGLVDCHVDAIGGCQRAAVFPVEVRGFNHFLSVEIMTGRADGVAVEPCQRSAGCPGDVDPLPIDLQGIAGPDVHAGNHYGSPAGNPRLTRSR